jgi:tetratricopeptide (TPR) repeat protein
MFPTFRIHWPVILCLLFLGACASKGKALKSKQASLYFGAGTEALMQKQYTEALTSLLKANELEPNNSDVLTNLGMAYYFKDEVDLATRHLNEAIRLNKKNSDARINLATIEYRRNNINEAEKLYKEVLRDLTYDKQARTYYNLGILEFEQRKNLSAAKSYFEKSIKEDENFCPSHFQLGMVMHTARKWNQASKHFRDASMGVCIDNAAAHYHQALTFIELNRLDDARIKLEEVDSRFGKTPYGEMARKKAIEIRGIESHNLSREVRASKTPITSPDF